MQYEYGSTVDESVEAIGYASSRLPGGLISGKPLGFTLMELMVSIAIFAVLAAIAIPNGIAWRNHSLFNAGVREVKSAIEGARMAAIRTNLPATVTFSGTRNFTTQTQTIANGQAVPGNIVNHQLRPGVTVTAKTGGVLTFNNRGMASNMTVGVNGYGLSRDIVISVLGSSVIEIP
jgi:prepilin-type N-terminal cleavage/methylation domain-containing protein